MVNLAERRGNRLLIDGVDALRACLCRLACRWLGSDLGLLAQYGGDSTAVASQLNGTIDVTQIFSTGSAFAALRADGSVVTWGSGYYGGDSTAVASQLNGTIDVTQIFSTGNAFAALRSRWLGGYLG